jgi:hypothetical protein
MACMVGSFGIYARLKAMVKATHRDQCPLYRRKLMIGTTRTPPTEFDEDLSGRWRRRRTGQPLASACPLGFVSSTLDDSESTC